MALRSVLFDPKKKMMKLSKCWSNLGKIRMNYSCHGGYRVISEVSISLCQSVLRISPGQVENYQLFVTFAGFSPKYSKRYQHPGTS